MMKVTALQPQITGEGIFYLQGDNFEIHDRETYDYKIEAGLVKDFEDDAETETQTVKAPKGRKTREKVDFEKEDDLVIE